MAIQRWDPVRDLMDLRSRMKSLFDDAISRSSGAGATDAEASSWQPPMDLYEEAKQYVLRVDLPGITTEDLEVQVEEGTLFLRGERRLDPGVAQESYLRIERPYGRFAVQVAIPPSVDVAGIRAAHRNGVAELVLPKRETRPPSTIEISS